MDDSNKNIDYGIYDRPGPKDERGLTDTDDITVGEDLPLQPLEQMSNQLTVERPPIEDEEYAPSNTDELSRAAKALASLVPSSQVEFFYKEMHALLDRATDKQNEEISEEPELEKKNNSEKEESFKESFIRKRIRKRLLEMLSDQEKDELDAFRGRDYETSGIDYFGDSVSSTSNSGEVKSKSDGTVSLDQIANEFGYSGASGVRQEIKRLTDRLQYFVTMVKREDLDALIDYAAGEYIDLMVANKLVDPEDADLMRSSSAKTKKSSGFRFFFVASFIFPAYREVVRNSTRALNDSIDSLGLPQNLNQTVFNQVTGASKQGTIAKKLAKMVKDGSLDKEQALSLVRKIESSIPSLKSAAEKADDLIQRSLDKWQSTSKGKKKLALLQALEQQEQLDPRLGG